MMWLLLLISFSVFSAEPELFQDDGAFIGGYDPVSYIKENKARKGDNKFSYTYKKSKIKFSSKENLEAFKAEPKKFLPAYHGYCAYAMARGGDLVDIDPKKFKVIDGKTYLFYDGFLADTLYKWNRAKNDKKQVQDADKNWSKLLSKK